MPLPITTDEFERLVSISGLSNEPLIDAARAYLVEGMLAVEVVVKHDLKPSVFIQAVSEILALRISL